MVLHKNNADLTLEALRQTIIEGRHCAEPVYKSQGIQMSALPVRERVLDADNFSYKLELTYQFLLQMPKVAGISQRHCMTFYVDIETQIKQGSVNEISFLEESFDVGTTTAALENRGVSDVDHFVKVAKSYMKKTSNTQFSQEHHF